MVKDPKREHAGQPAKRVAPVATAAAGEDVDEETAAHRREYESLMRKFWFAAIISVPAMLVAYPELPWLYLPNLFVEEASESLIRWLFTFLAWFNFGPDPALAFAIVTGVTVLIIACPCALGMAVPMSLVVGVGKGAENGVLIRNGEALQTASQLKTIVLDKTGTIAFSPRCCLRTRRARCTCSSRTGARWYPRRGGRNSLPAPDGHVAWQI